MNWFAPVFRCGHERQGRNVKPLQARGEVREWGSTHSIPCTETLVWWYPVKGKAFQYVAMGVG